VTISDKSPSHSFKRKESGQHQGKRVVLNREDGKSCTGEVAELQTRRDAGQKVRVFLPTQRRSKIFKRACEWIQIDTVRVASRTKEKPQLRAGLHFPSFQVEIGTEEERQSQGHLCASSITSNRESVAVARACSVAGPAIPLQTCTRDI
jgi:hypothetical protein